MRTLSVHSVSQFGNSPARRFLAQTKRRGDGDGKTPTAFTAYFVDPSMHLPFQLISCLGSAYSYSISHRSQVVYYQLPYHCTLLEVQQTFIFFFTIATTASYKQSITNKHNNIKISRVIKISRNNNTQPFTLTNTLQMPLNL